MPARITCILFEDDHLLVANKPAGLNTHAPDPYAGEGLYEFLRDREPRWANLAIIHRLDKETSGVIVFAKSPLANQSLTEQFTKRLVRKRYLLLTERPIPPKSITIRSAVVRAGDKYLNRPLAAGATVAETRFSPVTDDSNAIRFGHVGSLRALYAEPLTGRTHQIRVQAAAQGFAILGDTLYGGTQAPRVFLHAAELSIRHPVTGDQMIFRAPANFETDPRLALRTALINQGATDTFRLIHGASDGWPGIYVDKLGDYLLSQSENLLTSEQQEKMVKMLSAVDARGAYHKVLNRKLRQSDPKQASPHLQLGTAAPDKFSIRENDLHFELSFAEGYSCGLFLDQRENRRRLITGHIAAGFELCRQPLSHAGAGPNNCPQVLNTFAYTCGFSVAAAKGGACTTSLDLSKKYLEWGKRNFALNQIDTARHDFIFGDVFEWLRRLAKKGRRYDIILLDPPTFSQSKTSGVFRAEKDYGKLVRAALSLLESDGVLFASTNASGWPATDFLDQISSAITGAQRRIVQQHYVPQPPDFPISRAEPAYLKTVWLRIT